MGQNELRSQECFLKPHIDGPTDNETDLSMGEHFETSHHHSISFKIFMEKFGLELKLKI